MSAKGPWRTSPVAGNLVGAARSSPSQCQWACYSLVLWHSIVSSAPSPRRDPRRGLVRQTHSLMLGAFGLWFALLLPLRPLSLPLQIQMSRTTAPTANWTALPSAIALPLRQRSKRRIVADARPHPPARRPDPRRRGFCRRARKALD